MAFIGALVVFVVLGSLFSLLGWNAQPPARSSSSLVPSRGNLHKAQVDTTYRVLDGTIEGLKSDLWPLLDELKSCRARGDDAAAWRAHLKARAIIEQIYAVEDARTMYAVGAGYRPGKR
ncbi:MAG: hypothetical protein WAV90_15810 [Gordonia amarae]